MYKKLISSILVVALINLGGCYTYSALTNEEIQNSHPTAKDNFKIILKDGKEIKYEYSNDPNTFFVRVEEPSDFIYGKGQILRGQPPSVKFWGGITRDVIDSTDSFYTNKDLYQRFWLKDNSIITFKEYEYVDITPEDGTGYWISEIKYNHQFISKVEFNEIKEIQGNKKPKPPE